jgi:hypothetical protein
MIIKKIDNMEFLKVVLAKMKADREKIQAETKAIHEWMMAKLDAHHERTMAHHEATETEHNPKMMQSIEEHQEIAKREAAVMQVGGPMKGRRVRSGRGAPPESEGKDPEK